MYQYLGTLNNDILSHIMEFCNFRDINSISKTNKFFNSFLKKFIHEDVKFTDKNNFLLSKNSIKLKYCKFCGVSFKNLNQLEYHLMLFPKHNINRSNLKIQIVSYHISINLFLNNLSDFECVYGNCHCNSKDIKNLESFYFQKNKYIGMKIFTTYGYLELLKDIPKYNFRESNIHTVHLESISIYAFSIRKNVKFRIFHFLNHYWIHIVKLGVSPIMPITHFEFIKKLKYNPIHPKNCICHFMENNKKKYYSNFAIIFTLLGLFILFISFILIWFLLFTQ